MSLTNCEKKKMISELQKNTGDLELIDFMRKYFSHDVYADLFKDERKAKLGISTPNYDIRKYTFHSLHKYIPAKYHIDCYYVDLRNLKVIIFYEHVLKLLDNSIGGNEERNRKIKEYKEIYKLYKALISEGKCELRKYPNALKILGITTQVQSELDEDEHRITHETYANFIYDNILIKYIDEYKNYL
jgi:hypothetical protein